MAVNKPLVVVESPTKVRTIKKYLGSDYNVAATVGHVKDLPQKEMGIDIDDGFKPKYITIPGKQKVIRDLRRAAGCGSIPSTACWKRLRMRTWRVSPCDA